MTAAAVTALCLLSTACAGRNPPEEPAPSLPAGAGPLMRPAVLDGDSLEGRDGTRYRLIGINAPDRGECQADAAAARLAELAAGGVRVAEDTEPLDQFGRRLVYAFAGETFLNERLVEEGLAIAVHSSPNSRFTDGIFTAMARAVAAGAGVWARGACGGSGGEGIRIAEIGADPPGPDGENLDQEFVVVANAGTEPVDLTGWSLRDESTRHRYRFPSGFVLEPGSRVTITAGPGAFGFGSGSPVLDNDGDTVFVVDPRGRFVTFASTSPPGPSGDN